MANEISRKIIHIANDTVETNIAKQVFGFLAQEYGQREMLCALFHGLGALDKKEALPGLQEILKRKDIDIPLFPGVNKQE